MSTRLHKGSLNIVLFFVLDVIYAEQKEKCLGYLGLFTELSTVWVVIYIVSYFTFVIILKVTLNGLLTLVGVVWIETKPGLPWQSGQEIRMKKSAFQPSECVPLTCQLYRRLCIPTARHAPQPKNRPPLVVHATPVFLPIHAPLVFLAIHAPSNKYLPSHAYPF